MPNEDPGLDAAFVAAILDHVAHPVFVKDRQFRFVFLNLALCQLVGFGREQMLGKTDYDFFPRPEADFFRMKDEELFRTGREVEIGEETISDAGGGRHVLATTKVPLRGAGGEVTHVVGIIHDITRLKDAEDALRAANEQLEQRVADRTRQLADAQQELLRSERLAVLGQLVGGLAHQIRNPLGAITNAAVLLERAVGLEGNPAASKAMGIIHEEVWRANRIILDLVDYARVRPAERVKTELLPVVTEVVEAEDAPPAIGVRLEVPAGLCALIDRDQFVGALRNLVRNSVEALASGGEVTIAAKAEPKEVVISVHDTGPGIPASVQAHLFEPLMTTKSLGLGLGLVTARRLIENQGGSLGYSSSARAGTRFELRLPC